MSTSCSSNNDFTQYKKPYFSIEFTAKRLGVEVRLNDIPVFTQDNTGFMTSEIPASEYIINGNNQITIITFPIFDTNSEQSDNYIGEASIEVALYIREDDEPKEKRKIISKVMIIPGNIYQDTQNNSVSMHTVDINKSKISVTKDADILNFPYNGVYKKQVATSWSIENVKTTFPRWKWQDSIEITDNDNTYQSLLKAYKKLHTALSQNNISAIKKISEERSKELAIAYHLQDTEAGFSYSALDKDLNNPEISLHNELFLDHSKLDILGNGKIARIMNGAQTHPIVFVNYETEQVYQHQFMWYMNKNNEWVLIR